MDPAEIEFLAEKSPVEIIPNFSHNSVIHLITGDVGPFRAGLPILVPLWLAVQLKQSNKCRILTPDWMDVEKLEEKKQQEMNEKHFTKMPHEHYLEVTNLLIKVANDDITRGDEVKTLVKDIWDKRIAKLTSSVDSMIKDGNIHAILNHLTHLEINTVRPLLPDALNVLQSLQRDYNSEDEDGSQNTTRNTNNTNTSSFSDSFSI